MASLQDEVRDVCNLADSVLINPSKSIKEIASDLGLNIGLGLGLSLLGGLNPLILATWVAKKYLDSRKHEQEKERMLREVIRRQQAVIRRLEQEQAKARRQNEENRQEIENLKKILRMLGKTADQLNAA